MSSLTIIPTNLSKPIRLITKPTRTATILCYATSTNNIGSSERLSLSPFSAALALSSVVLSAGPVVVLPASADMAGLTTPYKESMQFPKREKQQIITKFALDNSAPALAFDPNGK